MKGPGNTVMKKSLLKIFIPATLILLGLGVFLGVYLYQKNTAEMNLGELQSLHYEFGGSNKQYWNFAIEKTGDGYLFTASVENGDGLNVEIPIDQSVLEDLEEIITRERIITRNGENFREEDLFDGWCENFTAEFDTQTIEFYYYGSNDERTKALQDFLVDLAERSKEIPSAVVTAFDCGDLITFNYGFSGGEAGLIESYEIRKDDDAYTLTIEIGGTVTSGEIDDAAIEGLMDIIVEQDLFAQNGVESRDENLCDGFMESLKAEFKNCDLSFSSSLASTRRNDVLCDYLLEVAEISEV